MHSLLHLRSTNCINKRNVNGCSFCCYRSDDYLLATSDVLFIIGSSKERCRRAVFVLWEIRVIESCSPATVVQIGQLQFSHITI